MGELFPFQRAGFPEGSSDGYPPERVVMLQESQVIRKHEAPGQGTGDREGIAGNKKSRRRTQVYEFSGGSFIAPVYFLFLRKFGKVLYKF